LNTSILDYAACSGANFCNANFEDASLKSIKLTKSNLNGCDLSNAKFNNDTFLTDSDLRKLPKNKLVTCNLAFMNLSGLDLSNVILTSKSLWGTNFSNTNLCGADLTGANWDNTTNFKGANLKGAKGIKTGGCYLTTACAEAMKLPDDCFELQTLREFRDVYLAQTLAGRKMIEEYYETAPEIVEAINATGNRNEIFKGLYAEINEIVSLIKNGESEKAVLAYRDLTLSLKNKYLN